MSRIGKKFIEIPQGVTVTVSDKEISVSGPKGNLTQVMHPEIVIEVKDGKAFVTPKEIRHLQKMPEGFGDCTGRCLTTWLKG